MSEILLAKPRLPPDFIDSSVGEPYLIRDNLYKHFSWDEEIKCAGNDLSYPFPQGYEPLIKFLEDKHQAPVIITNGAKQGLGATFYALQKMGKVNMGMRLPYWALIPPLAEMHGIKPIFADVSHETLTNGSFDSYLCVAPNNPDGWMPADLEQIYLACQDKGIPFIHDGAYYNQLYLSRAPQTVPLGDVQVFTFSKSLGLSGLRLGYVVCHNVEFYKHISAYMEAMTVGVSTISQRYAFNILTSMAADPVSNIKFEDECFQDLQRNKSSCLRINPEILSVPQTLITNPGMFGWFKVGPKADFAKSKIHFISGKLFGDETMVRLNLAFDNLTIEDIVKRLNSVL
jgi:aspartate/methionine/tyrosine aminotransferase